MAEDDGSFDAAKKHGKSNNHEVIEHFRSMAPTDNTRVANTSGPNADSRSDKTRVRILATDSKIMASPAMSDYDTSNIINQNQEESNQAMIRANNADRAKSKALKTANLK